MDIDPINLKLVLDLIEKSKLVNIGKFLNQHIIYMLVTSLISDKERKVIIKIGYSANILKRLIALNNEYKCKMLICGIGHIKSEQHEKEFHRVLKLRFPELVYDITIGSIEKDELYYCDERIINEFNSLFEETNKRSDKELELLISHEETERKRLDIESKKLDFKNKILEQLDKYPDLIKFL